MPFDMLNSSACQISNAINATEAKIPKIVSFICTERFLKRKTAIDAAKAAMMATANNK